MNFYIQGEYNMSIIFWLLLFILLQLYILIDSIKEKKINYFNIFHLIFYIFILIHYLYNNNELNYNLEPIIAVDMVVVNIYYAIKSSSVKKS